MNSAKSIGATSIKRLVEQGFYGFSDVELGNHRFGIRFAYFICMSVVMTGLFLKNQQILLLANIIALLGILPPYHPIDYLYNYAFRHLIGRPKLPHRSNQGRFACSMATVMLATMNYYAYQGNFTVVYIVGSGLLTSAFLVTFLDLCIPSKIYNALFIRRSG